MSSSRDPDWDQIEAHLRRIGAALDELWQLLREQRGMRPPVDTLSDSLAEPPSSKR